MEVFRRVNCADVTSKVHIVNIEYIVEALEGVAELDGFCNVLCHCFDHEIVLEGMKEEISQQRCTIGSHWYTNNLPENRASKTNVDVVDKKVISETKLSTREVRVPH